MGTKTIQLAIALAACAALATVSTTQEHKRAPLRVGIFDSRALAIAYAASPQHDSSLAEVRQRYDRAKQTADLKSVKAIEAEMLGRQSRLHKQGFSTAPVDDILAELCKDIAAIAEETGVDVIVNKWRLAYRRPNVELVDVTGMLVECFEPDERTRKQIDALAMNEPLPLYETNWAAIDEH